MADQIEITNVGKDGVASEVTLQRLLVSMEALAKATGASTGRQKKLLEEYNKSLKQSTKELDNSTNAFDDNTDAVKSSTSAFKGISGMLGGALMSGISGVAGSMFGLGKELLVGGNRLSDFAQHLPLVGGALAGIAGYFEGLTDDFRDLSSQGAAFNNNIIDMRVSAMEAGMSFADYSNVIANNSDRMLFFGGTVTQGAQEFGEITRALRTGGLGMNLQAMGFTMADLNEGLLNFAQLEARVTGQRIRDEQQLIQGSGAYLEELDRLAKITGTNRKQQADIMAQNAAQANVQAMMANMDEDTRKRFQANLNFVSSELPGFSNAFQDLADGIPQTELGKRLMATVPAFAELAKNASNMTQAELDAGLKGIGPQLQQFRDNLGAAGITALSDSDGGFAALFGSMYQFQEFMAKTFDPAAAAEEQRRREAITTVLGNFEQAIENIRTRILLRFFDSGFAERATNFLENSITDEDINRFSASMDKIFAAFEDPNKDGFQTLYDTIKDALLGPMVDGARKGGVLTPIVEEIGNAFESLIRTMENTFVNSALARTILGIDREDVGSRTLKERGASALTEDSAAAENLATLAEAFAGGSGGNYGLGMDLKLQEGLLASVLGNELSEFFRQQAEKNQNSILRAVRTEGVEMMAEVGRIGGKIQDGTATEQERLMLGQALERLQAEGYFLSDEQRSVGTLRATGRLTEPKNTIAKIHAGERVLNPKEASEYNNLTNSSNGASMDTNGIARAITGSQQELRKGIDTLNSTMSQAANILQEIKQLNKKQLGATKDMGAVY